MATAVSVLIEEGRTKCFASAVDWPGWARASRDAESALAALESYRRRYAAVLAAASITTPTGRLVLAARVRGDAGTDFGAPTQMCDLDRRALRSTTRATLVSIVSACWDRFDEVSAAAGPLRLGPKGGGRSVDKMVAHVHAAEVAYARKLGLKVRATNEDRAAVEVLRAQIVGVLTDTTTPDPEPAWPPRYAARRIAWHVCDHLFEMEDRSTSR